KRSRGVVLTKNKGVLSLQHLSFLNWNSLYLEIQGFKSDKGYHNLGISLESLKEILQNVSWYSLYIPANRIDFSQYSNVRVWQELAITLLKKYIEQFYL